jgi:hypothetical protein
MSDTEPLVRWPLPALPLDARELSQSRWSFASNFLFAANLTSVPIVPTEFMRVAHEYPIGFAPMGQGWIPVALLDRQDRASAFANYFVDRGGQWKAAYVPFLVRVYPFAAELNPAAPSRFALSLVQDSDCMGPGLKHACETNGELSQDTQAVAKQIHQALSAFLAQAFAARTLDLAGLMRPLRAGTAKGGEGVVHVLDAHEKARFAENVAHWYRISPMAVQMAVAAFFSYVRHPDLRSQAAPVRPRQPQASRAPAPAPVSQDLSWLDFGDKISF